MKASRHCPSCTSQITSLRRQLRHKEHQLHQQKLKLISLSFRQEMKAIESSFTQESNLPKAPHFFSQRVIKNRYSPFMRQKTKPTTICSCNNTGLRGGSALRSQTSSTPQRPSGLTSIRKELRWEDSSLKNKQNRAPSRSMLYPRVSEQLRLFSCYIGRTEPKEFKNSLDEVLRSQSIQSSEHESERIREAFRKELFQANQRSLLGNGLWASHGSYQHGSGQKSESSDLINISSPE